MLTISDDVDSEKMESFLLIAKSTIPPLYTFQTTSKAIALDIGVDRLELTVRPNLYHLHIDLPFTIESNETVAQFNKDSKILFVTLPVNGIVVDNVL